MKIELFQNKGLETVPLELRLFFVVLRDFIKNENETFVWKNLREHRENGGFL